MKIFRFNIFFWVVIITRFNSISMKRYSPEWGELDSRPLPQWYDEAKVGILLHWGVYCVPGFGTEWFWIYWKGLHPKYINFMNNNYPPGFTYQEFAPLFKAEFFDPDRWANLFAKAGAKYIILTSKHHEGYSLFPSKQSFNWNSVHSGPQRDLVGDLAESVRKQNMTFGVYYSLYEWFNPMYLEDKKKNFGTNLYVVNKLLPDITQLVRNYKPSIIWSDGDWEANEKYWNSKYILAWLYNMSPVKDEVVVNDRWGMGIPGKHGDFYSIVDKFSNRSLLKHKWENTLAVDSRSWGYRRNMSIAQVLSTSELIYQVVTTVSCGGNVLISLGPTKEGTIAPIFEERLLSLGNWLAINGKAIYKSSPWLAQRDKSDKNVWYTCTKKKYNAQQPTAKPTRADIVTAIYAISLVWPKGNVVKLKDMAPYLHSRKYKVVMLGNEGTHLKWRVKKGLAHILFPDKSTVKSKNAWTLKFTH